MKLQLLVPTIAFVAGLQALSVAQTPESFFPTEVGNLWQYSGAAGLWQDWGIQRDSIASDGYRYLYVSFPRYPGQESWWYRLDYASMVYRLNGTNRWGDTLYHLAADSGDVWVRPPGYSWVLRTYQSPVFGRTSAVKVIRSGPFHPDSGGNSFYDTEQHLASGFGVIYHWEEPGNVVFLRGCVVAGDTFGTIVTVKSAERELLPQHITLRQNYPNPFNPFTTIEYEIAEREMVGLRVFDLVGRQVKVLAEGIHERGKYTVRFDGNQLASGEYFYRMETEHGMQTKRMLLLR